MAKFIIQGKIDAQSYWNECIASDDLYITIKHFTKYSKITFDAYPMLINRELAADCSEKLENDYRQYAKRVNLPAKHFSCIGGSTALSFTVWKEDAENFASALYDYIYPFLISNRIITA